MNNNYSVLRAKDINAILDGDFYKLNIPNYHTRSVSYTHPTLPTIAKV